jgi:hypothetical protein
VGQLRRWVALSSLFALLASPTVVWITAHAAAATTSAGGLSVFVGYAEDKEINTPNAASFPVPWAGAPNTIFLGGTVPGQGACGTLTACYDAGAIRLDNGGSNPVTVNSVSVDDHSSIAGGNVFNDLWGSFTVPAGESVILTENPPVTNPSFDNFDTSSFPSTCTPLTVAPTVTITVASVQTTLVDSTHVLDTGGVDPGSCPPQHNESAQWRPIGAEGANAATLSLTPGTMTQFSGHPADVIATVLDGGGSGIPNAMVAFTVTSGPDAGQSGTATTDTDGHASFSFTGVHEGEDVVVASVTTVGTFQSNTARVMWADDSSSGWSSSDIGNPTLTGGQSLDTSTGTWTVQGAGTGVSGTADEFHFVWQAQGAGGGVGADVTSQTNTGAVAQAGVMLRASTDSGSPYYAAFVTPSDGIIVQDRATQGAGAVTVANAPGTAPTYLWVTDTGSIFTTYSSVDGYNWTSVAGSTVSLNLSPTLLAGLAATSDDGAQVSAVTFNSVAVSTSSPVPPPPAPCPSPWSCADIGNPTLVGSQSFDPGTNTWTISAGGSDITGTADQFHFVSQPLSGDGSISARVASQTNSSSNAKAGVMLRATTDPGSPNYAVLVSPGAGIKVQERSVQGGTTVKLANPAGTAPAYVKVTRSGNTFTAYTSADGVTWNLIAGSTFTMTLGSTVLEGLAVTSHNSGILGTATMDTVKPS